MRERRLVEAAVVTLLLAPLAMGQAPAAWDELAGGAARTGAAFLPTTTLDVLDARDLFDNDTEIDLRYSKGLVSTPHGLLALAQRGDACVLLRIGETVDEVLLRPCADGTLTAYDRANDRILVCAEGDAEAEILQAHDASTGALAWAVRPVDLASQRPPGTWNCRGSALAGDGTAVVAFWAESGGVPTVAFVARLSLDDGGVVWDTSIAAADLQPSLPQGQLGGAPGGFTPYGVSITESGIVVSGRATCACGKGDPLLFTDRLVDGQPILVQGAVAWLDAESGRIVGSALAEDDPAAIQAGAAERWFGQWWATTQGPLAAFALGERVLIVNPSEEEPVREAAFSGIESGHGFSGIIPSAWWGDVVLVPIAKSVTAIDADSASLEPIWSRTFGEDWIVSGLLALPPADALVLVAKTGAFGGGNGDTDAALYRLDLATGQPLQRVPLPGTIRMSGGTGRVGFQPLDDGRLLIYSLDGRLLTLGQAEDALKPPVHASTTYPSANEGVELLVEKVTEGTSYVVAWGDGAVEEGGTRWTHRYGTEGPRIARVTALYDDGRTATTELTMRVGATPPPELTPLQRAFAPGNQDLTFGILGILITLVGALLALLLRRRRRSRLHEELRALERIREDGRQDPAGAIRALGAFRERLLAQVGTHALDDAQFHTLDARAGVVFSALRTRLLGPLAGRLSADFRHALDVVLHDGRIDPEELTSLRGALEAERDLRAEERQRLASLLERMAGAR